MQHGVVWCGVACVEYMQSRDVNTPWGRNSTVAPLNSKIHELAAVTVPWWIDHVGHTFFRVPEGTGRAGHAGLACEQE